MTFKIGDRVEWAYFGEFEKYIGNEDESFYDVGCVVGCYTDERYDVQWDSDDTISISDTHCLRLLQEAELTFTIKQLREFAEFYTHTDYRVLVNKFVDTFEQHISQPPKEISEAIALLEKSGYSVKRLDN